MSGGGGAVAASGALAQAVAATDWASLPAPARAQALDLFRDTLAVIAAGAVHPDFAPWLRRLGEAESGPCTAIGLVQGVPAATAALLNGGATTVLQWQDGHRMARGHPASHLVPALLALAEARDAPAAEVMSAFVGGYEAGTRIGIALGGLRAPLHDGGTWATLGAAAACARLLGGDAATIAAALEAAATLAPMGWRDTVSQGATVHHLFIGLGAGTALTCAQSAFAGLGAIPGTLERFFGPRAGADFRPAALTDGIGEDGCWSRLELGNAYLKWHPVCAHFSGLADALVLLQQAHRTETGRALRHDEVAAVEVALYGTALAYDAPRPASELAARFSAAAIVHAALDPEGLAGPALARTAVDGAPSRAWLERVQVLHDPSLDAGYPAGRPVRVTLRLLDGRTRPATVRDVYGDRARPLTAEDRGRKWGRALGMAFDAAAATRVLGTFDDYVAGRAPIAAVSAALRKVRAGAA
jgi:2-methylcitrate dehydratase PrpD